MSKMCRRSAQEGEDDEKEKEKKCALLHELQKFIR